VKDAYSISHTSDVRGSCSNFSEPIDSQRLEAEGFSILNEVVLNQVLVSFGDAETTQRVIRLIQEDGTCWCGGTVWHGQTAMRISIASWATDETDIERSLSAIIPIAKCEARKK
jgi:hypothetical protein